MSTRFGSSFTMRKVSLDQKVWTHPFDVNSIATEITLDPRLNDEEPSEAAARIRENTARAIKGASRAVVERHITNCTSCHPDYGKGVSDAVGKFGAMPVA